MLARMRKAMHEKDEGFTLIELLVVIIIIGILAAIAIPVFLSQRQKGYDAQTKSDLRNMATAEETYATDSAGGVYQSCTSATACSSTATTGLGTQGFKASSGDSLAAVPAATASNGYCIFGLSKSGKYFVYDSQAGGLQATTYTAAPALAAMPAGGACATLTASTLPTPGT